VEIENVSSEVIEIEVMMHPLQNLDLVIVDEAGAIVPAAPYSYIFSPHGAPYNFRLAPGEKYTHCVSLLGTLPYEERLPGTYTVHAIYEYNGLRAVSEPVQVQIPPPNVASHEQSSTDRPPVLSELRDQTTAIQ
jgi:hypothetical protein